MRIIIANLQKYYGIYLLIIAVLFFVAWFSNRAANRYANRYAISATGYDKSGAYIIDTKTGQMWFTMNNYSEHMLVDLGTPKNPKIEVERVKRETKLTKKLFGKVKSFEDIEPNQ